MTQIADAWLQGQERRWLRPDAHRWFRPDAERWSYARKAEAEPRSRSDREREWQLDAAVARARHQLAAVEVLIKARRFIELCRKYSADQPRVPPGSPEGGQWTDSEGSNTSEQLANIFGGLARVIDKLAAIAPELAKVFRQGVRAIDAFRKENFLYDLFGKKVGTIAITSLDDKDLYGFNSGISEFSGQYTDADKAATDELRDRMLAKYSEVMPSENIGSMPNNALYHAETNVLLRAARENGGTLSGKELRVFVDGSMCPSCEILLPYVGLELGNPTVTFIDIGGVVRTMRDGSWVP